MTGPQRIEPSTGSTLILAPGELTVLRADGSRAFLLAPPGYTLSHFGEGILVVGRGDALRDGWWDWYFEPDFESGTWRRTGPAY